MEIAIAELPAQTGEDRAVIFETGVVVLDGATSHDPSIPPATRYVDALGRELADRCSRETSLPTALADAIQSAADELDLQPYSSPSSTVAVVRVNNDVVELLVLGDSTIVVGCTNGQHDTITDDRLNNLSISEASEYQRRLAKGSGYDETHRRLLQELQRQQRAKRNQHTGYWIAEADPSAAEHAVTLSYPRDAITWAVVTTDGARDTIETLGIEWSEIAAQSPASLHRILARCHEWEAHTDPYGRILPRSKRHDDKTVAVVRL
ncbi:protein phosphatase 2C domain-containing protein [Nocardia sp. NPDC051900]|uniref:protein phosphatase 2C domain-containing protein n=1 Tax=Nocardia sp. NPDC051900 TaxID=3364326 RepID=UPI0037BCF350